MVGGEIVAIEDCQASSARTSPGKLGIGIKKSWSQTGGYIGLILCQVGGHSSHAAIHEIAVVRILLELGSIDVRVG